MRCWYSIPVSFLDNEALLGEHREIPTMLKSLSGLIKGWKYHPETKRWLGHTKALRTRHDQIASEMVLRGMNHNSPIPENYVVQTDSEEFTSVLVEPLEIMYKKLNEKKQYRLYRKLFKLLK